MNAHDYHEIDRFMSKKAEAIYGDPKRHAFYSCHDAYIAENMRGVRGGRIRGKKLRCFHCGRKKKGHAETTEQL